MTEKNPRHDSGDWGITSRAVIDGAGPAVLQQGSGYTLIYKCPRKGFSNRHDRLSDLIFVGLRTLQVFEIVCVIDF
jgi:hypothetical protein